MSRRTVGTDQPRPVPDRRAARQRAREWQGATMSRALAAAPRRFRLLFEFLLSHHAEVVYVGCRGGVGTLQSAERAAQKPIRSACASRYAQRFRRAGPLAVHAAERALAGASCGDRRRSQRSPTDTDVRLRARPEQRRARRRIPRWALPITQWLRLVPVIRLGGGDGRVHVCGVVRDRSGLPARFVARVASSRSQPALARRSPPLRQRRRRRECAQRAAAHASRRRRQRAARCRQRDRRACRSQTS